MPAPNDSRSTLVRVFLALLLLLAATAIASRLPTGPWSLPLSLLFAVAKVALIFTFFMQLRKHGGIVRIFAFAGFFWLALLAILASSDFATRGWS